ncbi:MAG TPA: hypothetical protein ENI20_05125 [Bacteroides sp.]|nr:hypothetical protein [Bacteroides sp.]
MNGFIRYFLLLVLCSCPHLINAQAGTTADSSLSEWKEYFDLSYGYDPNLVNGIRYLNLYPNSDGHPFLAEDHFYNGSLVIGNTEYEDVDFKYDICNQKIILQYSSFTGGKYQIVLNNEFVNEFKIDNKLFRKYSFSETGTRFFQIVTSGNIYCLYYWEKDLTDANYSLEYSYKFSSMKKKAYIIMNDQAYFFRNKRSFLRLFPEIYQKEIKQFIRANRIMVSNGSEKSIGQLVEYCNQLADNK